MTKRADQRRNGRLRPTLGHGLAVPVWNELVNGAYWLIDVSMTGLVIAICIACSAAIVYALVMRVPSDHVRPSTYTMGLMIATAGFAVLVSLAWSLIDVPLHSLTESTTSLAALFTADNVPSQYVAAHAEGWALGFAQTIGGTPLFVALCMLYAGKVCPLLERAILAVYRTVRVR